MSEHTTAGCGPVPLGERPPILARSLDDVRAFETAAGLWCLRLPLPYRHLTSANAVLLDGIDGGQVLVDCGPAAGLGWAGLERALALAGSSPERITTLVCTHLHADHAEMAPTLVELTGCRFLRGAGPEVITSAMREWATPLPERHAMAVRAGIPEGDMRLMVETYIAGHTGARVTADVELAEGDEIETVHGSWQVVPAHGHSPNQIALYQPQRRWLISADAAFPAGDPYVEQGHTADPFAEYFESLNRLGALSVELVIPGHGRPDDRIAERLRGAERAGLDVIARVAERLDGGPASAYEVASHLVGENPNPDLRQTTLSIVISALDHLTATGAATTQLENGVELFELTTRSPRGGSADVDLLARRPNEARVER